ncbi:hypothetical protein Pelo_17878 [Pelomyxa schiedti]|nr:hypothetical protein Pelo_17878 [Pelomyxa schiedti]
MAFCSCKRHNGSCKWSTSTTIHHLQHYDEKETRFLVVVAEAFYPMFCDVTLKRLQLKLGSFTNIINACAAHGALKVGRHYLKKYWNQFQSYPVTTPGVLHYGVSHEQFQFLEVWLNEVSPSSRTDRGHTRVLAQLHAELQQRNHYYNLQVAICMGIALAWRSSLSLVEEGKSERAEVSKSHMKQLALDEEEDEERAIMRQTEEDEANKFVTRCHVTACSRVPVRWKRRLDGSSYALRYR